MFISNLWTKAKYRIKTERILWLYALPYDPSYPAVCFDEHPCFLIGETVDALSMQSGQVHREHIEID